MNERGVSIVELIVYIALGLVISTVLTSVIISGFTADSNNRDRDAATGEALVVQEVLQSELRAAHSATVSVLNSGQGLSACVASSGGAWQPRSWQVNAAGLLVTETASVLARGVTASGTTPIFELSGVSPAVLTYNFNITKSGVSVPVTGRVLLHANQSAVPSGC
jgi:type II secretory pathway pseudopilin PulG